TDRLDVLILRDPVLREIRLPVIVHRMRALHPGTREVRTCPDPLVPGGTVEQRTTRDAAAARALLRETNVIWGRARIRFDVRSVIDEAFATAGRNECAVDEAEFGDVLVESATPNVVNVYLFGTLATSGTAGMHVAAMVHTAAGILVRRAEGVGLGDRVLLSVFAGVDPVPVQPGPDDLPVILGHVLGLQLGLPQVTGTGPQAQNRLMLPQHAPTHRRLVQAEVVAARGAPNARDCIPLRLEVTGAVRFGGPLGHRFAAIRDATAAPVDVREVFPPHLLTPPGSSVATTGGTGSPTTGAMTVSRSAPGRQVIASRYEPGSAGGAPLETHVVVYVFDFDVDLIGARRLAPAPATRFYAIRGAAPLTARAILFPEPSVVPGDLAIWGPAGTVHPDPLRRRVPRVAAGAVSLPVTVAGVTRTIELTVAEDFRLEVPDAVRLGPDRFLAVIDPARSVTIRAILNPAPNPLPADLITWGGTRPTIAVSPTERTMARTGPAGAFTVTATIGDVTHSVTIELVTMSLRIDGAFNPGPPNIIEFYAPVHPTERATAVVTLDPPPSAPLPAGAVVWDPASLAGPDPLRGMLSRAAAGRTLVRATLTGTTRAANFNVYTLSFVSAAIVPAAAAPPLARVQIEGLLDTALASVDRTDLFGTQPDSLFRLRAEMPAGAPTPATMPHRLVSRTGVGPAADIEPLDLTLTAVGGVARLQSLPVLAVSAGFLGVPITLAAPPDMAVIRAQAGGRLRVDGVPAPETRVRGRVVHIFARVFTGSNTTPARVRLMIPVANRIWAQAGVEVRERSVAEIAPPAGLLDLDTLASRTPFSGTLSAEENTLLGITAGGNPPRSATANDMNLYFVRSFTDPDPARPAPTAGAIAYATESFSAISEPGQSAIAYLGAGLTDNALAHELGHHLLRGWPGDEHDDNQTPPVAWPVTNVMHFQNVPTATQLARPQVQNVLDATAGDTHPVSRFVE
ncbi:MAG TPA: hypothetical protein VFT45_22535, partial [Longimicrobium sp.]|nr:hypothetical protein [Longimicrobium sp.]